MSGSYKEASLEAKRKREGIEDQRESVPSKKKKVNKPWVVAYEYIYCNGRIKVTLRHKFANVLDAIKQMKKIKKGIYAMPINIRVYHSEVDETE